MVAGSVLALGALWYLRGPMEMGWAVWGYGVAAGVASLIGLWVVVCAFLDAGGGGPREWHALSDLYALVNDTPWWGKVMVVLGGIGWALV